MRLLLIITTVLLLLLTSTTAYQYRQHHHHRRQHPHHFEKAIVVDGETDQSNTGYIFTGEQSICSCRENIVVSCKLKNILTMALMNPRPSPKNKYGQRKSRNQ